MSSNMGSNPNPVYDTQYNEWGELTSLRQGSAVQSNLLTTQFSYNVRGWLTNTLATTTNGTQTLTQLNMSYGYDANGNVKSLTNTGVSNPNSTTNPTFSNAYSYDWLDRLTSGSSTAVGIGGASLFPAETYQYDNLDRMTTRTIGTNSYPYAYTDPSHVDAPTSYRGNGYSYDANGDQLTGTVNGTSQSRTYDQERRLVQVTSGTTTLSFIYDGNGQRLIQKVVTSSSTTSTLYVGGYEETLTGASNPPYIVYYMLGGKTVGLRRANYPVLPTNTNGQYRIVNDQLGSTTLLIDTATVPGVVQREYYKPFGEVAFTSGSSRTDKGFTGQRLDAASGLMYYGARYYDPALSYFISPDSVVPDAKNPMDYNRYLYVHANPLRYLDPLGYSPKDYYLFVNGCSATSGQNNCGGDRPGWDEYLGYLHQRYNGWQAARYRAIHNYGETELDPLPDWDTWAYGTTGTNGHVRFAHAQANTDTADLESKLAGIPNDGGSINLIGHSYGGGAILYYLSQKYEYDIFGFHSLANVDNRIASVALIDSPSEDPDGGTGAFANWLYSHTRIRPGSLLQVTSSNSVFPFQSCMTGFDCREADYSQRNVGPYPPSEPAWDYRIKWHSYTFSHVYGSNFIDWFSRWWS